MRLGGVAEAAAAVLSRDPHAAEEHIAGTAVADLPRRDAGLPQLAERRSRPCRSAAVRSLQGNRPPPSDSASGRPAAARTASWVGGIAAIILLPIVGFLVMTLPFSRFWDQRADGHTFDLASASSTPVDARPRQNGAKPRLLAHETRGMRGEPVRLGLTLAGPADGGVVTITGLVPGMSLSSGRAAGADTWQVAATELAESWVGPPQDFVGAVELSAELRLADATIAHRQSIHIEWIAAPAARPDQAPTAADPAGPGQVSVAATPPDTVPPQPDRGGVATDGVSSVQPAASQAEAAPRKEPSNRATRSRGSAKASVRRRASDESVADEQDRAPPSPRWSRTSDGRAGGREFIDEDGNRHVILPRLRREPIEHAPVLPYDAPLGIRR
jgi:hypothetical protein